MDQIRGTETSYENVWQYDVRCCAKFRFDAFVSSGEGQAMGCQGVYAQVEEDWMLRDGGWDALG